MVTELSLIRGITMREFRQLPRCTQCLNSRINSQLDSRIRPLSVPISEDYDNRFIEFVDPSRTYILLANNDELFAAYWSQLKELCSDVSIICVDNIGHRFTRQDILVDAVNKLCVV